LDTVAVRCPDHGLAQALLHRVGRPLAAPSANRSGDVSPTRPDHVRDSLGPETCRILDGGPCAVGLESTILDLSGAKAELLRPGSVTPQDLAPILGYEPAFAEQEDPSAPRSPGRLLSHYAPRAPVRLDCVAIPEPGWCLLGFDGTEAADFDLSPTGDLVEAAANLFASLRALDAQDPKGIAVAPIPETGIGLAILDRLRRAAAPRD
ncbi:MAG: L-threonylcarbamoyladenylate synthase, partial [Rhodospirillaceae bacterium]